MKRILLIFTVVMLSTVSAFATWDVYVEWDATSSNCNCSTNGYFLVQLNIEDVANGTFDETYYLNVSGTVYNCTFDNEIASDLQDHCSELNQTYPPNYTVTATVVFMCYDTSPPSALCNDSGNKTGVTCSDFSTLSPSVSIDDLILD